MRIYKEAIRLRRESQALREGALIRLKDMPGVLAYARFVKEEVIIVLLNRREEPVLYRADILDAGLRLVPVPDHLSDALPTLPTTLPGSLCVRPTALYEGFYTAVLVRA